MLSFKYLTIIQLQYFDEIDEKLSRTLLKSDNKTIHTFSYLL